MLTHRWAILRKAIPMGISIKRTVALVIALAKLHNFCIEEKDNDVPAMASADELVIEMEGAVPLETADRIPLQLLGGGSHFDDHDRATRRRQEYRNRGTPQAQLPRDHLLDLVDQANLSRPVPISR